ncbi:hypothetical protein ABFX02_02G176100 [Erythranthe guttata]
MEVLKLTLFLFFLQSVQSKNHCPTSYCGNNSNTSLIQYPFKLRSDDQNTRKNCTYIDLKCTTQDIPILNLPNSGDFYVRYVDYENSVIKLYDPENCLPKRLMSLNLSFSYPLMPMYILSYTFYTCPFETIALSNFTVIDCLSNSTVATVATYVISRQVMTEIYMCSEIVRSYVPVLGFRSNDFIGNQTDFILRWVGHPCENCPRKLRGRIVPLSVVELAYVTISLFTVVKPFVICIGCCVHFVRMFRKEVATNNPNVP